MSIPYLKQGEAGTKLSFFYLRLPTSSKSSSQDDLEDAFVDRWGEAKSIARIEFPSWVKIGIHRDKELVLLNGGWVETSDGPQ